MKNCKSFVEIEDVEVFDYEKCKKNVDSLFSKYRSFKKKIDIIKKRYKACLSLDNLGIYSTSISDPVGNTVEQADKYERFINTIDSIYEINKDDLSADEIIVYKKSIICKCTDEDLSEFLSMSKGSCFNRKRSCYIKVARWFDLEEYK